MRYTLFAHGGSGNHGCEAIVRSVASVLNLGREDELLSDVPEEDACYGLDGLLSVNASRSYVTQGLIYKLLAKMSGNPDRYYYRRLYRSLGTKPTTWALSIGGDNYCYHGMDVQMMVMHQLMRRSAHRTALVGCSVESETLSKEILDDMRHYDLIWARESLTHESLCDRGFKNVKLIPDPAFCLNRVDLPLPKGFVEGNTVGINMSPLIMGKETQKGMAMANYRRLIEYIINETNMQVALIPHVVWATNDDRLPLQSLHEQFCDTGRVLMLEDHTAEELKGYIARCRFLVAARTHASIAAYSQQVPTLVVGYSIKARGIARDLFGTEDNYVLPVQKMTDEDQLMEDFRWLMAHEEQIKKHYAGMMPEYIKRIGAAKLLFEQI